jgi:hypothetical protein
MASWTSPDRRRQDRTGPNEEGSGRFGGEAPGDLCYYAPWGNLAMFHGAYRRSQGLIRLGRLDAGPKPLLVRGEFPLRVETLS